VMTSTVRPSPLGMSFCSIEVLFKMAAPVLLETGDHF
jgi:hypothetical protein